MSEVLSFAVPIVSVVVLLLALRGVRRVDVGGKPVRFRIHRGHWLAFALFFLTFAAGDFLILLIDGGVIKHLVLIVPAVILSASFMYKAQSTPT